MRRPLKLLLLLLVALAMLASVWRIAFSAPRPASAHAVSALALQQRTLAVIVHKSNPTENLSTAELREYFLSERTSWPTKQKVRAVMIAPGRPERQALIELALDMRREQDYQAHFLRAKFTEQATEQPRELQSAADVLRFVSNVPGALAYVPASEVDPSVKVVRVDGLAPGDPGYRLRF
ncbi:MAG TPA: hypothetical protein VK421_09510 [Pyrinomonadaceae bacterium]|nr:hypothetical protein [Pyrinomonadaceae bacterium]